MTTDGFLLPNAELERRGLLQRKAFRSPTTGALLRFVIDIKSGQEEVFAPVCSHLVYDTVPDAGKGAAAGHLDLGGLNVLQPAPAGRMAPPGLPSVTSSTSRSTSTRTPVTYATGM